MAASWKRKREREGATSMLGRCGQVYRLARVAHVARHSASRSPSPALTPVAGPRNGMACFASSAAASEGDSYSVLIYDYVPDILERRGPYRAGHIGAAKKMVRVG